MEATGPARTESARVGMSLMVSLSMMDILMLSLSVSMVAGVALGLCIGVALGMVVGMMIGVGMVVGICLSLSLWLGDGLGLMCLVVIVSVRHARNKKHMKRRIRMEKIRMDKFRMDKNLFLSMAEILVVSQGWWAAAQAWAACTLPQK